MVPRARTRHNEVVPELPDLDMLRAEFAPRIPLQPTVQVHLPPLAAYDQLVGVQP